MAQSAYQPSSTFAAFPPVVKNLLILNALIFAAQAMDVTATYFGTSNLLEQFFALFPIAPPRELAPFYPWQIITYAFLHGDIWHLLFNMFGLWMFGQRIENLWGSRRFALFYFVCVVGAALCQLVALHLTGGIYPTLGASGGVLGVLLAFGMMYPDESIYLYFFIPVKSKYLVVLFAVFDLFAGWTGANTGVAHFAHLGGMLFGLVLILYWRGKLPIRPSTTMR